ncbi:MAG: N-acetyl-gamma-glutamyl-phosphate reductase [Candidatus Velthaea sp.]
MTTVHVIGATGYAGAELIRLLHAHPDVRIATLESRSSPGARLCDLFPSLPRITLTCEPEGTTLRRAGAGDVVFLAGNHELARAHAPALLQRGARVIDLSDAFRLTGRTDGAVYGFPERYHDAIAHARFVANPGCYVTAALLALAPLGAFAERIAHIVIDAKSGITGAGRVPSLGSMFAEVDEDVRAYGLTAHRHGAEIEQEARAAGLTAPIIFSPHVVPLRRGLLADVYLMPSAPLDRNEILAALVRFYAASPFVTVFEDGRVPHLPSLEKTNDAQLAVAQRGGIIQILSGIDNLGKGAAGEAVQNMNLMLGLPEERGFGAHSTAVS